MDSNKPIMNEKMLEALASSLFKQWEALELQSQQLTRFGRSIIQNFSNPQMSISKSDLLGYIKHMQLQIREHHKTVSDLTILTAGFVNKHICLAVRKGV